MGDLLRVWVPGMLIDEATDDVRGLRLVAWGLRLAPEVEGSRGPLGEPRAGRLCEKGWWERSVFRVYGRGGLGKGGL